MEILNNQEKEEKIVKKENILEDKKTKQIINDVDTRIKRKYNRNCLVCGYIWKGIKQKIKCCPRCKRYDWDVDKKEKSEEKGDKLLGTDKKQEIK